MPATELPFASNSGDHVATGFLVGGPLGMVAGGALGGTVGGLFGPTRSGMASRSGGDVFLGVDDAGRYQPSTMTVLAFRLGAL